MLPFASLSLDVSNYVEYKVVHWTCSIAGSFRNIVVIEFELQLLIFNKDDFGIKYATKINMPFIKRNQSIFNGVY